VWILDDLIHPGIVLLAAPVGEIVTGPAGKILASWRKVDLGDPFSADGA